MVGFFVREASKDSPGGFGGGRTNNNTRCTPHTGQCATETASAVRTARCAYVTS